MFNFDEIRITDSFESHEKMTISSHISIDFHLVTVNHRSNCSIPIQFEFQFEQSIWIDKQSYETRLSIMILYVSVSVLVSMFAQPSRSFSIPSVSHWGETGVYLFVA